MEVSKLFNVLVLGGALMANSACDAEESSDEESLSKQESPDSGSPIVSTDATPSPIDFDASGEPVEGGFCPNDVACEVVDGVSQEREGFTCCWSTSC